MVDLMDLADNMPKIKRSNSEPYSLHYTHNPLEDNYLNSPHTPPPVQTTTDAGQLLHHFNSET